MRLDRCFEIAISPSKTALTLFSSFFSFSLCSSVILTSLVLPGMLLLIGPLLHFLEVFPNGSMTSLAHLLDFCRNTAFSERFFLDHLLKLHLFLFSFLCFIFLYGIYHYLKFPLFICLFIISLVHWNISAK